MRWWKFFGHAESQHDAIGFKDQRERRLFHEQAKAQRVPIEISGTGHVDDGDEADDVVFAESGKLRLAAISFKPPFSRLSQ